MALKKGQIARLHKVVRLHVNWFVRAILGDDALTTDELVELSKFKKLSSKSLGFIEKSFILGRLKALFKNKEWKSLSWEDFLDLSKKQQLSPLEKLVLQQAKLSAAQHIRGLGDQIAAGVFDQLAKATNKVVSEASLKELIRDEVKLAILEKKSYQELSSSLAKVTKTSSKYKWNMISRTELHTTKTAGLAQAIINKVDIYKNSQGINSKVSIVPKPGTCPDCEKHYLDGAGNPKVFTLGQLMMAGSNADPGVSHTKRKEIHTHWKTTLPCLHPHCRCTLQFVAPGYSWVAGKLKLTDKSALIKSLRKGNDSTSSSKPSSEATKVASIPGAKSPEQATPPPTGGSGTGAPAGVEVKYVPKSKSPQRPEGSIGDTDLSWKVIPGVKQGQDLTPEQEQAKVQEEVESAKKWGKEEHPHAEKLDHLSAGRITNTAPVGDGINGAERITIEGNGRGLLKAGAVHDNHREARDGGGGMSQGWASVPHDTYAEREKASYTMAVASGLPDLVPPTTTRLTDKGVSSTQSWLEDYKTINSVSSSDRDSARDYLDAAKGKEDLEKRTEMLNTVVGYHFSTAANDGHNGNVMINPETGDLKVIDMGMSFANGMDGVRSNLARSMHNGGYKIKLPDKMISKYEKMGLGDIKRGMGDKFDDWEHGQQFMRQQYLVHLMKTEGHLDYNKFKPVVGDGGGVNRFYTDGHGGSSLEGMFAYEKDRAAGTDPHSLFEGFSKAWIEKAQSDPSHPHHSTANQLSEIGIFMPPQNTAKDAKAVRDSGDHLSYAKSVKAQWPEEALSSKRAKPMSGVEADSAYGVKTRAPKHKRGSQDKTGGVGAVGAQGVKTKAPKHKRGSQDKTVVSGNFKKSLYISDLRKKFYEDA